MLSTYNFPFLTFHTIQILNYSFPNHSYHFYLIVYSLKCIHVWFFFSFYAVFLFIYILEFLVSTVSGSGYFLITISKSHGQNFLCIQILNYSFPNLSYHFYLNVYSLKCIHVWFFFSFYAVFLYFRVSNINRFSIWLFPNNNF